MSTSRRTPAAPCGGQNLADFRGDPLPTDDGDLVGHPADGLPRLGIQLEIEPGGKTHGSQHPQLVLGESLHRIADRPDPPALDVFAAADVIDHFSADRIEEQPIDREIAARCVRFGGAEVDPVRMPSIGVAHVIAEGGDLDLPGPRRPDQRDHAERGPQRQGPPAAEERADLVGLGIRRHVVVLRLPPEQLVAHAAAGPIRQVAGLAQPEDHVLGELAGFLGVQFCGMAHRVA